MEVKQFKLSNNDEIICSIVSHDAQGYFITVDTFKIINVEDDKRGLKYYYFKPFMVFQEQSEQKINSSHIIAEGIPTDEMLEHYAEAIKDALLAIENRMTVTEDELESMESEELNIAATGIKIH